MKTTSALPIVLLGLLASPLSSTTAAPLIQPWGLHLDYIDKSVKPGDDFYLYANGLWQKTAEIPSDRTSAGGGLEVTLRNDQRLKDIVADLHTRKDLSAEETKLRDLYDAYADEKQIAGRGLAPVRKDLDAITNARTREDIARLMMDPAVAWGGPYRMSIDVDDKAPTNYIILLNQSGLGMPDRDYYLRDDKALEATRAAYKQYLAQTLATAGVRNPEKRAAAVYQLEHDIAVVHWPAADRRDADKTYNVLTIPELRALAPDFPWETGFTSAGVSLSAPGGAPRRVIVREKSAFPGIAKVFAATPVPVWRDWLTIRAIHRYAAVLPKAIDDADFAFFGKVLQGRSQQLDRSTRAVRFLDNLMGEALGKIYAAKYFPPEAKAKMQDLVAHLLRAFEAGLQDLPWMTEPTRVKAREKLKAITVKVGYPDTWRDYTALVIRRDDLIGDVKDATLFQWHHDLDRLDGPVDRAEWGMTTPTVNAYYNSNLNEIVFPAGILQSPWFDLEADDAVNYGSIGGTIGHEISHGFDDQGSKFDGAGVLRMWWTPEDRSKFEERTSALAAQYDQYEPLPGLHVNGKLTLGENIGDLSGLAIAHKAYQISLGGHEAPVLDGLTGDQRFYLAYAQSWRSKVRDEATRQRTLSNPHSPPDFRVLGVVRNDDGWYKAFPEIGPNDKYYLPPDKRVRIW